MEIRDWAIRILSATTLEEKLLNPEKLTDNNPGPPVLWDTPNRPPNMGFQKASKKDKLPPFHEHSKGDKRAICLHRFAGHELLAVEMMAYALLAFPEAPKHFRKGLVNTLKEEQWHVKIYKERINELGSELGDEPLNGRFWTLVPNLTSPLKFVSTMNLTLEMANLDFAPHYCSSFLRNGDEKSARLMQQIFNDEIKHVSFGYHWFKKFKPNISTDEEWSFWKSTIEAFMPVKRARGFLYQEKARASCGLPENWIQELKKS